MRKKRTFPYVENPSALGFSGQPDSCFELVNRYGTYNIQSTADTDNEFPAIAQGIPRHLAEKKNGKEQEN